jgi:hypothetical protein
MLNHKIKIVFPAKFNSDLENLPMNEQDSDWWITDGEDRPDDRPHVDLNLQPNGSRKYSHICYFHLHRTLHDWLVERDISYIIECNRVRTLSEATSNEEWSISFKNESDAILFKLTWF